MRRHSESGFALVAIAALLIVAAIIAASLLLKKDNAQVWETKTDTKAQMQTIEDALIGFQRANHRLPCAAPVNAAADAASFGTEGANCAASGGISGITRVDIGGGVMIRIGALPVRTLGLGANLAADAWANRFSYVVMERLTDPYQFSDVAGSLQLQDANASVLVTDGAFAVISHGADGKGAFSAKTGAATAACTASAGRDQENCDNDAVFIATSSNPEAGAGFYDDAITLKARDVQATGMNIPCYTPRTPSPYAWTGGCSASFVQALHGATQTITDATVPNTGSADVRCENGAFVVVSESCTP